jgi:hypothetical protein
MMILPVNGHGVVVYQVLAVTLWTVQAQVQRDWAHPAGRRGQVGTVLYNYYIL